MTMTFNQLRHLKDSLPDGAMTNIAKELNISVETVRNYFGGANYDKGEAVGIHFEQGPDGGLVKFDDQTILDAAKRLINEKQNSN